MSRARARSRARTGRPPSGGLIPWMLSVPARLHLRWLVIAAVLAAAMGLYAHTLTSAAPMPPSKAPVETARSKPAATAKSAKPATTAKPAKSTAPKESATHKAHT